MAQRKPVNQALRPVKGGFIRRIWLGDQWAWRIYDENREPFCWSSKTRAQAEARLRAHAEKRQTIL